LFARDASGYKNRNDINAFLPVNSVKHSKWQGVNLHRLALGGIPPQKAGYTRSIINPGKSLSGADINTNRKEESQTKNKYFLN